MNEASKTIIGRVVYEDNSAAVTTASVSTWAPGVWADSNTDNNGYYSMKVTGGEYEVCLGDRYDDNGNRVEKDWYSNDSCDTVEFADNTSAETATVNFRVGRTDALVTGVFKHSDNTFESHCRTEIDTVETSAGVGTSHEVDEELTARELVESQPE